MSILLAILMAKSLVNKQSNRKWFINSSDIYHISIPALKEINWAAVQQLFSQRHFFLRQALKHQQPPWDTLSPLRQTLINLCVLVWISQLNLWHTALPEHCLHKYPLLTDKSCTKTRLAACHCLHCSSYWKKGLWGSKPKGPFIGPESSTWALRLEAKGQLVVRL